MISSWPFEIDDVENWVLENNFLTAEECQKIILMGDNFEDAKIKTNDLAKKVRSSQIQWIYPNDQNSWLFYKLAAKISQINDQYFKFDLFGFVEALQLTKYEKDDFYGKHIDKRVGISSRKLSATIQLSANEDYEGGEFSMQYGLDPYIADKNQGSIVVFPSYTLHEVKPVTSGTRYSLVVWANGKNFK